ncbi:hypothetical protein [Roseateles oligotrophus]|uniref:Uncharacterized protein n=1 Tax=Roseateles oligotrophus TaxID=1769250 RepID=A0ABT2YMQ7_9BURK|nr:hypothetical protein [Roseateles oligotrophus]MCV2371292.1 hypothetical protein [Roseateles oligotrophus]
MASRLTATVLAVVLGMAWRELLDYEVSRLDERLCMEARRAAGQGRGGRGEDRFVALLDLHWPQWREARKELNALPLGLA